MCLAIPSRIVNINNTVATVEAYGGVRKDISLLLLPEEVSMGDYVIVHAGFAIQKIDEDAAKESHRLLELILKEEEAEL